MNGKWMEHPETSTDFGWFWCNPPWLLGIVSWNQSIECGDAFLQDSVWCPNVLLVVPERSSVISLNFRTPKTSSKTPQSWAACADFFTWTRSSELVTWKRRSIWQTPHFSYLAPGATCPLMKFSSPLPRNWCKVLKLFVVLGRSRCRFSPKSHGNRTF